MVGQEFISVRFTRERQQTNDVEPVSNVLKMFPGLCQENMGHRSAGMCNWTVEVKSIIDSGSIARGPAGIRTTLIA